MTEVPLPALKPGHVLVRVKAQLADSGLITVVIDRTFPLHEIREAFDYFILGKFKEKIVMEV